MTLPPAETHQPEDPRPRLGLLAMLASALFVIAVGMGVAAKLGWLG